MKIYIIGAGAMGMLYASMLNKTNDVTLIDANDALIKEVQKSNGFTVKSYDGTSVKCGAKVVKSEDITEPADLVIVFVKDTVTDVAVKGNMAAIGKDTIVLSLQNGIGNADVIEKHVLKSQILLGTTKHNCVVKELNEVYHSAGGKTVIGSVAGNAEAAKKIVDVFKKADIETEFSDNVNYLLWEKLFTNMTINPVTALLGAEMDVLGKSVYGENIVRKLVDEAVTVAKAEGLSFDGKKIADQIIAYVKKSVGGKASMCQDVEKKRKTEIDFINGAVLKAAKKHGLSAPTHEAIVNLIHLKETTY